MQSVSPFYVDGMKSMARYPSKMRLTFHYPTGDVVYTNKDIVKVTEKKSAHLIADELPTIDLTMQLVNLNKSFDPNRITNNLHDMIIKGIFVNYEFGYDVAMINPYGYPGDVGETYDPVYGIRDTGTPEFGYITEDGVEFIPAEAYGYLTGYQTEWIDGGEVFTSGELSYDATTVTITAVDYLSLLDDAIGYDFRDKTLAQIAHAVINLTDYPEDEFDNKKLITGSELDAFSTSLSLGATKDDGVSLKDWLQTIAHAGGVKMYFDRLGYIHLDNDPEDIAPSYTLTLQMQQENPQHTKMQIPKQLTVELNTEYGEPVELAINGGGDEMIVSNPFIITTAQGVALRDRVKTGFIDYRHVGEIEYRGEPALDILDRILLQTQFENSPWTDTTAYVEDDIVTHNAIDYICIADNTASSTNEPASGVDWETYWDVYYPEAIITEHELTFDGTLSGSLSLRYQYGGRVPDTVYVEGGGSFIYRLGVDEPSSATKTLTCQTSLPLPTFSWEYFRVSTGSWTPIVATTASIDVAYNSAYFDDDDTVKFRCTVNGTKAGITSINRVYLEKSVDAQYQGAIEGNDVTAIETVVSTPRVGDVALLDNTGDDTASIYGIPYHYDGEEWVPTEDSEDVAQTYKDALAIAADSGKQIYAAKIYTDLLVANEGFITNLEVIKLKASEYDGETLLYQVDINETDGIKFVHTGETVFHARNVEGNPKVTLRNADVVGTLRTGDNAATDARVAIRDEVGVIAPPAYKEGATGLDDLTIVVDSNIAGKFKVEITDTNSDVLHNEEQYWTLTTLGDNWRAVAVNSSGRFVAVGGTQSLFSYTSEAAYSDDGVTWYEISLAGSVWRDITVNNDDRFVVVGKDKIAYSDNGINWTVVDKSGSWRAVDVGSPLGRFIVVGDEKIGYSDNGETWISIDDPNVNWLGVVVSDTGECVGVAENSRQFYSPDISTLYRYNTYETGEFTAVTVDSSGRFTAVGDRVKYTDNGFDWYSVSVGTYLTDITVSSSGRYLATGYYDKVCYSDDGINWGELTLGGGDIWRGVAVDSQNKFVIVSSSGKLRSTPLTDIFKWTGNAEDATPTWHNNVPIPNSKSYTLNDGIDYEIIIGFENQEGHTIGDYWTFEQKTMRGLSILSADGTEEYVEASNGSLNILKLNGNPLGFIKNSATDGTVRIPGSDLIMKWGTESSTDDGSQSWTFDYGFEFDEIYSLVCNLPTGFSISLSTSGFSIDRLNDVDGSFSFMYIAIGKVE